MKTYIVLYREEAIMCSNDAPFTFICQADDGDHAEEQCLNANPDGDIVWVYEGEMLEDAYADYWDNNPEEEEA